MRKPFSSSGKQLYAMLPELYRTRDNGDLAAYLDVYGALLDRVRNTLDQRLADCFPDNNPDPEGLSCQPWLIPYFAQLIDTRLYAPDVEGRREEVAKGIGWRKRKGTISCIEEIAEAVGQMEIEVHEGWKRVAITPRIDMPLTSVSSVDNEHASDSQRLSGDNGHPGLPASTVDMRYDSAAVVSSSGNPAARENRNGSLWWRQSNGHGTPVSPGSFDDRSRRTVDMREEGAGMGYFDARKVLLFAPPHPGFASDERQQINADQWQRAIDDGLIELTLEDAVHVYRNRSGEVLQICGQFLTPKNRACRFEGFQFEALTISAGCHLQLLRCTAVSVTAVAKGGDAAKLTARDSLFDSLNIEGVCQLEYCTVLSEVKAEVLLASDSLFPEAVTVGSPGSSCVRYSRVPDALSSRVAVSDTCTIRPVLFFSNQIDIWPEPGCAVLHPASPDEIRFGAEDGGEMGAYHHRNYCLRELAIIDKLKEFLPLGLEPVLILDSRLSALPNIGGEA